MVLARHVLTHLLTGERKIIRKKLKTFHKHILHTLFTTSCEGPTFEGRYRRRVWTGFEPGVMLLASY